MRKFILILILIIRANCFASNQKNLFFESLQFQQYDRASEIIPTINSKDDQKALVIYLQILKDGEFKKLKHQFEPNSFAINLLEISEGISIYINDGNELESFRKLKTALELAKKRNDSILVCEASKAILEIYERFNQEINDESYQYFLNTYFEYAYSAEEQRIATYFEYRIKQRYLFKKPEDIAPFYKKANKQITSTSSNFLLAKLNITNSAYHQLVTKDLDSSNFYLKKAKTYIEQGIGYFEKERQTALKINNAVLVFLKGKPKEALSLLNRIESIQNDYLYKLLSKYISFWKYQFHTALKNKMEGLSHYKDYLEDELLYNQSKNLQIVSDFETKYQTAQKEKQILEEQALKKRNQNIALGLGGTLALGSIIAILIYRNAKRKQRIAEQEKELEIQKTTTLLKEQEINTINAIIEGQEKERTRLASELHDNLGGTLAAVKMHIGNLQTNLQSTQYPEELLEKANTLISAAYKDVRNIAHAGNSGVMAKDGLLPAVQKLARTLSSKDTLTIEVQDYGLTKRLNNDLEITIFRIIQELVTNIVKHANASQASISLTQHQEELSIIVEDNGVGFIAKKLEVKNGMGLGSIERRVEHLEGAMEVDSTPGRGTNILIDIPL